MFMRAILTIRRRFAVEICFYLLLSLLSTSCKVELPKKMEESAIFPTERFAVFEGKRPDGKPIVGNLNLSYRDYARKPDYPWCLTISIALDQSNLFENGLPKGEESSIANKLEDDLFSAIKQTSVAHYVGHVYGDEFLDIYIYLDEPKKVNEYLQTQINKQGLIRPFRYEIVEDKDWKSVDPYLNPK
ncbi:hypothetical protein BH10ACI2_BH10ACI2_12320 [soil metagenome]